MGKGVATIWKWGGGLLLFCALGFGIVAGPLFGQDAVSLDVREGDLREILQNLAKKGNINLILSPKVRGTVTCRLENMMPREIIEFLVRANGYLLEDHGRVLLVMGEATSSGRIRFEVISLQNANAAEVEKMIRSLQLDKRARVTHDARTNRLIIIYDQ